MKSLLSPKFRLDWSRERKIFPAHPPWGRCGCDGMKPCVAAGDHVLMLRFMDRHSRKPFRPHCPLRRKKEGCVSSVARIVWKSILDSMKSLSEYIFYIRRYICYDLLCMTLSYTVGISDHIACDCHFISFVMEGKLIDLKSSCFFRKCMHEVVVVSEVQARLEP